MKKNILTFALFLVGLTTSNSLFGQVDLDVSNTTGCPCTIDILWTDGTNCTSTTGVAVGTLSAFTSTNPMAGGTTAVYVTVYDNTCGYTNTVGDCTVTTCISCSYAGGYVCSCPSCGSTVLTFQFTPAAGGLNARIDIF